MSYQFTQHGQQQMQARGISKEAVQAALRFGRRSWIRGACLYAIGRRDAVRARRQGLRLDQYEGVHVVTSPDGVVLTVYRNHDLRGLRR